MACTTMAGGAIDPPTMNAHGGTIESRSTTSGGTYNGLFASIVLLQIKATSTNVEIVGLNSVYSALLYYEL